MATPINFLTRFCTNRNRFIRISAHFGGFNAICWLKFLSSAAQILGMQLLNGLTQPRTRIKSIAQTVAQEIERKHSHKDKKRGEEN